MSAPAGRDRFRVVAIIIGAVAIISMLGGLLLMAAAFFVVR